MLFCEIYFAFILVHDCTNLLKSQKYLMIFIGFLVEFVVTFVLVLTVYAAAADEENDVKGSPPLAIGLAITIGHLFAVSLIA